MLNDTYYSIKPLIPRRAQLWLRRGNIWIKKRSCGGKWPIDEWAAKAPDDWKGWPEGKKFALVLTHDVETAEGRDKCPDLAGMEKGLGFRSSFNFVPERYKLPRETREDLARQGFEIGVHDLTHDGKLFRSRKIFQAKALLINQYLKEWNALGFRSGSMHRNLEWMHDLDMKYDSSTFDTDPFEPEPEGVGTIFPFWVSNGRGGYLEMPYTLPQDFTMFVLMRNRDIDVWKRKLDWIAEKGGMALLCVHPDYMNFDGRPDFEEYPAEYYERFLRYVSTQYGGQYWSALPRDVMFFFKGVCSRNCG